MWADADCADRQVHDGAVNWQLNVFAAEANGAVWHYRATQVAALATSGTPSLFGKVAALPTNTWSGISARDVGVTPTTSPGTNNAIDFVVSARSAGGNGGVWYCTSTATGAPAAVQAATCTKLTTISLLGNSYTDMVDVALASATSGSTAVTALLTAAAAGPVVSVATPSQTLPTAYSYINTNPYAWTSVDLSVDGAASLFTTATSQYIGSLTATTSTQATAPAVGGWADVNFVSIYNTQTFGAVGGNVNPGLLLGSAAAGVITVGTGNLRNMPGVSGVATSATGVVVVASTDTEGLYLSTNAGYTFAQIPTFPDLAADVQSVACDSDCSVIVACTYTIIYTSSDQVGVRVAVYYYFLFWARLRVLIACPCSAKKSTRTAPRSTPLPSLPIPVRAGRLVGRRHADRRHGRHVAPVGDVQRRRHKALRVEL